MTDMPVARWEEERAAAILEVVLDGELEVIDPGGGPEQLYDLRVRRSDGSTVAVEVTSAVWGPRISVDREVRNRTWESGDLHLWWSATCTEDARVKALHAAFPALFQELETIGIREFACSRTSGSPDTTERRDLRWYAEPLPNGDSASSGRVRELLKMLHDAGLTAGCVVADAQPGGVSITVAPTGWAFGGVDLCDALASALGKDDNRTKLGASGCDERNLFLWVSHTAGEVAAALRLAPVGSWGPHIEFPVMNFPDEIDAAWVAAAWTGSSDNELTSMLFRVDAAGWHDLGPVVAAKNH